MMIRIWLFVIVCVLFAKNVISSVESDAEILRKVNEYYGNFRLSNNKSVVLVLGNKGAGKSLLTKLLTTDSNQIVVSGQKLKFNGNSTIPNSIIPELMVDLTSHTTFYDCPVIDVTTDSAMEISAALSIQKILQHANEFKILFVIKSQSMSNINDTSDFIELAERAINLIKDIRKYSDGIALVVWRIENVVDLEYDENKDRELIEKCIEFLIKTETKLIRQGFLSDDGQQLNSERINFINALLKNERIKILRTPMKIESIQIEIKNILSIINMELRFVQKDDDDFWCNIRNETKQTVPMLINQLKMELKNVLPKAIGVIHKVYMEDKQNFDILSAINEMLLNSQEFNPNTLKLPPNFERDKIISHELDKNIAIFEFLQQFSLTDDTRVVDISSELQTQLRKQVADTFSKEVFIMFNTVKHTFLQQQKLFYLEIDTIYKMIQDAELQISHINTNRTDLLAIALFNLINEWEIVGLNDNMRRMSRNLEFASLLKNTEVIPPNVIDELIQFKQHFTNLKIWYNFVLELRNQLSTYAVQQNKVPIEVSFMKVYIIGGDDDTVEPHIIDLQPAFDYLPNAIANRDAIESVRITRFMLKSLQSVWSRSLANNIFECNRNHSIVKGDFISLRRAIENQTCWSNANRIEFFALNKIFIDTDIDKRGLDVNLTIISPIWEIIPSTIQNEVKKRQFLLIGRNVTGIMPPAADGNIRKNPNGTDGMQGITGGIGGNFLGIGSLFVNDMYLEIDIGGGKGNYFRYFN